MDNRTMKAKKTELTNIIPKASAFVLFTFAVITMTSCMGEVKEKLKKAKQGVSNVTTIAEKAQQAQEDIENLKDAMPLTNEELKKWLPESIEDFERTGFKVGAAGYANVASIEGTYKHEADEQKLTVNVIDGAGQAGSMMIAGMGMTAKMDMEQEDEHRHIKAVKVDGIRVQQIFHKKRNETVLQFVVDKRFGTIINGVNMKPDETWKMVEKLNLNALSDLTR